MKTEQQIINIIQTSLSAHKEFWNNQLPDMKRLRSAYLTKFYEDEEYDRTSLRVETSDGYSFIESYIASLFEKSPAVEVDSNVADNESIELARQVVNNWIGENRKALENGSRLALIYPMAFFKLSPVQSTDPLNRVRIRSLEPWDVILDREADSFDEQRFVGHHYFLTVSEARKTFGNRRWLPITKQTYFDETITNEVRNGNDLPDEYKYVEIVEFYDLLSDMLYFFSPNLGEGKLIEKITIPLRTYDNQPLPPIVSLYYSRVPDKPLDGYSTLARVYDQLFEKNVIRTFWANAVRRDSRQYLYKEGAIDEEGLAKITAGIDGTMIPVDNERLDDVIKVVPTEPLSSNFSVYLNMVEQDINRGSIISPNAKGEATGATATEITALSHYTASEIGRMARERDEAIEDIANVYLRMLVYTLEPKEKPVILVNKKPRFLTPDKIDNPYKFFALDQASTPLSKELKKRQLIELLPVLTQLGVPLLKVKEEIIRRFELPDSFLEAEPTPEAIRSTPEVIQPEPTSGPERLAQELLQSQRSIDLPIPQ